MRSVYAISGGVSKFAKARPDKTFQAIVKEAYDYSLNDIGINHRQFLELVDGSVCVFSIRSIQRSSLVEVLDSRRSWES